MRWKCMLGCALAFVCLCWIAAVCPARAKDAAADLLDPSTRQVTVSRIRQERAETIQGLIAILERKDLDAQRGPGNPLLCAIELLGELRAREAVKALSDRILYLPEIAIIDERIPREAYYPAAVALTKIGNPAVYAMLDRIEKSDVQLERDLAAWVIMSIEGQDQAGHRMSVLANKRAQHKGRYEEARKYIVHYKPILEPPGFVPIPRWQPRDSGTKQ